MRFYRDTKHHGRGSAGTTIIEVLAYVTILAMISVIVIQTILSANTSFGGLRASKEVNLSALSALDVFAREIRGATSVDTTGSVFDTSPGILSLNTTNGDALASVLFRVENGTLVFYRDGAFVGSLLSGSTTVNTLLFEYAPTQNSELVKITLGLTATTVKTTKSETFYTSAVVRSQ
ncbi:MAG: hypothetical protein COW88_02055 [Candidatus Lloydbacteria bacterium CG22_combo_CG10-13_8_21_14_all_47_15]|uniref:Uncharacterized protein n=1 Tax=Candidatus Lloydbacteria bacterium CG22_combo_CG10-13_8_21_14_all_47_15 TaxID=1974635 RepID=A0A2H0CVG4_9BACT|nr:MAG: hypothetical protein COW88_02055 [Candidatus Lloydbacteria bacterium CG22_combo_CG10-13_8_21_14_all_47_15]